MIAAFASLTLIAYAAVLALIASRSVARPPPLKRRVGTLRASPSDGLPIAPERLTHLVSSLLAHWGMEITASESLARPRSLRLIAARHDRLCVARHVVYVEARPFGDIVRTVVLDELLADVAKCGAAGGILFTPGRIEAGEDCELELIDGARLRELVEQQLPELSDEVRRYRLIGRPSLREITS